MSGRDNAALLRGILAFCKSERNAMLRCLRRAVELESPTGSKVQVDRMANYSVSEFKRIGGEVEVLQHGSAGASVVAEFWGDSAKAKSRQSRPILLLGHLDTVWDVGTIANMPFRIANGKAYGPGVLDMKSGIVCGLWAIRALRALKVMPKSPVRFFLNSDEEAHSRAFRSRILSEGRGARAALVLEPSLANGALKTARKGVGEFRIMVHGRAAHAGVNPAAGVNAVSELARQVARIESFARPKSGLTVNVGTFQGGTRPNVVPERAWATVDVRVPRARDQKIIEHKIYGLRPIDPRARLEISGGIDRPPMERAMAVRLFAEAKKLARQMGFNIDEAATGGGSDGNFTAALGVPTLDGLGGVGDGAHARHEHILIRELPKRAALLAALIASI